MKVAFTSLNRLNPWSSLAKVGWVVAWGVEAKRCGVTPGVARRLWSRVLLSEKRDGGQHRSSMPRRSSSK